MRLTTVLALMLSIACAPASDRLAGATGAAPGETPRASETDATPRRAASSDAATAETVPKPPEGPDAELTRSVEAEYGFGRDSSYETLLTVLSRAQSIIRDGGDAERARAARFLALSYIPLNKKLNAQYDFVLQQPEFEHKASAAFEIAGLLHQGERPDHELASMIADKLCADLASINERNGNISAFIGYALPVLLMLKDSRGLDIVLTDSVTMKNQQRTDGWQPDDGPERFRELARQYREDKTGPGSASRAALYEMFADRKAAGGSLEPLNPVLDLEAYMKLLPKQPLRG